MFERLSDSQRITLAKTKMDKVLGHFLNLLALHESNAIIVFSPMLASQIPRSYAANAFNVFQRAMHDFELIRLCALWDCPRDARDEKESIPTVVELIERAPIVDALAEEFRRHWANIGSHNLNPSSDPELRALEEEAIKASNASLRL
jgi:AbiU2